jgi:hypothetical protein
MHDTDPTPTGFAPSPGLLDSARDVELTPAGCNLDFWIEKVAQGALAGLVGGHRPDAHVPAYVLEPGPVRESLVEELAFRAMAEEDSARAVSRLVRTAPDTDTLEFFATQLLDEARHARVFRGHLVELGVPAADLIPTMERVAGESRERILRPLAELAPRPHFIEGVAFINVLAQEVLGPFAELAERKWRKLDPAAADVARSASVDEIRHLTVGAAVIRRHLRDRPNDKRRMLDFIARGRGLCAQLPVTDTLLARELRFQEGLDAYGEIVRDCELEPGRRLVDTTPEERVELALAWSRDAQQSRLAYMGLGGVVPPLPRARARSAGWPGC